MDEIIMLKDKVFQSTSSIQRKTSTGTSGTTPQYISIHFLYTEEDSLDCPFTVPAIISIHFLYTEEDRKYQQMNILHQDILYLILT